MGYILIIALLLTGLYSTEIRCSLGNKGACQALEVPLEQQQKKANP